MILETIESRRRDAVHLAQSFRNFCLEHPTSNNLHQIPTLVVVVGTCGFIMSITYFLKNHILSTKDEVLLFVLGSYVTFSSYFMIHYFLEQLSTSFRKVSREKRFYTISNMIKAGMLAAITPFASYELYMIIVYGIWNSAMLHNLGCIYAIPDFVSLLLVRNMHWSTIIHHVCVCIFNYFSIHNDYSNENVCRLIVVYAGFSTFAYSVNMLLASRWLGLPTPVARLLAAIALCTYASCCLVNWTWQVYYIRRLVVVNNHWTIYLYIMLILFVIWDDLVLTRWLIYNLRRFYA